MATKLCLTVITILAALQSAWLQDPSGCNVPPNIVPTTLLELRGIWYLQATTGPVTTRRPRCIKLEVFTRDNGRRGIVSESYIRSYGNCANDPNFITFVRPGVSTTQNVRNFNITEWLYVIQFNDNSGFLTFCSVEDETSNLQTYRYFTRQRIVPRQTINDAFTANNVPLTDVQYINQTGCFN